MAHRPPQHLQALTKKVCSGHFDWAHVGLLLILLRTSLTNPDLRDLTDFIAHPEGRNKGPFHGHLRKHFDAFKRAEIERKSFRPPPQKGLKVKPPSKEIAASFRPMRDAYLFDRQSFMQELDAALQATGVTFDSDLLAAQAVPVYEAMKTLLVGCQFDFEDAYCQAMYGVSSTDGGHAVVAHFTLRPKHPRTSVIITSSLGLLG